MATPVTVPRYTVAELERLPDDGHRYELLDGVLLVTPPPEAAHQGILVRLLAAVHAVVGATELAHVVSPGAIYRDEALYLEPDLLVDPARFPLRTRWRDITEHWLVAEVYSPSSRSYDREFKRRAYHALGVPEVWLVDLDARTVEVSRRAGNDAIDAVVVSDVLRWHPPGGAREMTLDLGALFHGLGGASERGRPC